VLPPLLLTPVPQLLYDPGIIQVRSRDAGALKGYDVLSTELLGLFLGARGRPKLVGRSDRGGLSDDVLLSATRDLRLLCHEGKLTLIQGTHLKIYGVSEMCCARFVAIRPVVSDIFYGDSGPSRSLDIPGWTATEMICASSSFASGAATSRFFRPASGPYRQCRYRASAILPHLLCPYATHLSGS